MVVGGTVCVVTVLLLLLVIMVLILVHKRRARHTEKEKEDPFSDYVLPPHMPAIPLSGDSVQLKENTAYNPTEASLVHKSSLTLRMEWFSTTKYYLILI